MTRRTQRMFGWIAGACVCVAPAAGAAQPETMAPPEARASASGFSDAQRAAFLESFDHVWLTIKNKHFDENLNGVDWELARDELRPGIETAESEPEARSAMNELLARLGQSHFGIIASQAYDKFEGERTLDEITNPGWTGIVARMIGDEIVVTAVRDRSPARDEGVKTGWAIESINGRSLEGVVDAAKNTPTIQRPATTAAMIMSGRLLGNIGDTMEIRFVDLAGNTHDRALELIEGPGKLASIGELPPSPVEIESRTLADGVGYFRLSIFLDPQRVLSAFEEFVRAHEDAPGIIIDVRGNPGGLIPMASGMMNWLIAERGLKMGEIHMRSELRGAFSIPMSINPWSWTYEGRVAVLIDEMSVSNSEILAAGLKDVGRARVFGVPTAGLVLPSVVERLPNGDGFQYAFASYTSSGGGVLEGVGAIPDVEIPLTREALVEGDPVLDAARVWIGTATPDTVGIGSDG